MISLGSIAGISDKIANSAYKEGTKVSCDTCKSQNPVSKEQFAQYLAKGWPKCCNKTMSLVS